MEPYSVENLQLNWIFMHDNDLKHKSKSVTKWITEKKIRVSNWLAQSPDLNPIENLWYEVKKVKQMNVKNKEELWRAVQKAWNKKPVEKCQHLVESIPRRCQAVIKTKVFLTKY